MGWEHLPDSDAEYSGDAVWDVFTEALTQVAAIYEERFHRKPTRRELQRGLEFVIGGDPARYVHDAVPGVAPRLLNAAEFEASCGDVDGDIEPAFIARRATGADAIRMRLAHDGRLLRCEYEIVEAGLTDEDVRWLFVACYLTVFAGGYYADKIDTIRFSAQASPETVFEFAYPA